MQYVRFGNTGLKVSRLCLGCMTYGDPKWRDWVLDGEHSLPFIRDAWERGINFFDTADMYSLGASETVLGEAIRELAIPRDGIVIATKVFHAMGPGPNARGNSRKHIFAAIDASLKRLGTDHVDLYQIHRFDPETPMEETVQALHDLVKAGKALHIGASSMRAWQFGKMLSIAAEAGLTRFASMQNLYNLVYREEEREMLPLCASEGIAVIPWSPLARGYLAGTGAGVGGDATTVRGRSDGIARSLQFGTRQDETIRKRVAALAEKLGARPAQVALAWVLSKGVVTAPIIGASKPHHIADALGALDLKLERKMIERLEEPYEAKAVAGHD